MPAAVPGRVPPEGREVERARQDVRDHPKGSQDADQDDGDDLVDGAVADHLSHDGFGDGAKRRAWLANVEQKRAWRGSASFEVQRADHN